MTSRDSQPIRQSGDGDPAPAGKQAERNRPTVQPALLLSERVAIPDRMENYFHRAELIERISPASRRLTLLMAPGGFGKTTALAASCQALRGSGVLTAWLTLDVEDTPQALDAYLAFAFEAAGLAVSGTGAGRIDQHGGHTPRATLLAGAIERFGAPCVLALDETERITSRASLQVLNGLVQWGPPNLHVAMSGRKIAAPIDVASAVFEGRAELFSADDFRFARRDVARYFGSALTRGEVAELTRASRGWPIALRVLHSERQSGKGTEAAKAAFLARNWIESSFWRGFSKHEKELLLDVGLFDQFDADLLDEVLQQSRSKDQLDAIVELVGLTEPVRGPAMATWRLHPLLREHCAKQRLGAAPERHRQVHRRIAAALARRDETVAAMRHARKAGDPKLAARILNDLGAVRLWLRHGLAPLQTAIGLLDTATVRSQPRLLLGHCVVLAMTGRLGEARRAHSALEGLLSESGRDAGGSDLELQADHGTVRGLLCLYGCEPLGSERMQAALADLSRLAALPKADPLTQGSHQLGLCIAHNLKAEFDSAMDRAVHAERCFGDAPYLKSLVALQRGQAAMAQGRVAEAADCYAKVQALARSKLPNDPAPPAFAGILMRELELERNRPAEAGTMLAATELLATNGAPLAASAAVAGTFADLAWQFEGLDAALAGVAEMRAHASAAGLAALLRYLSALQVALLARQGRVGDAQAAWRSGGLPERIAECMDLERQSWREMEALACARILLHRARAEFDAARACAGALLALASERGLRRTQMRGLALLVTLEVSAGRPAEAEARLVEYLGLFAETDYARPLAHEREACLPLLEGFLAAGPEPALNEAAAKLRAVLTEGEAPARIAPELSGREQQVLQRLDGQRDKQIAADLDLSEAGVRYHIGNIFGKLGVQGRQMAVRRARHLGLLP